MSTAPVWRPRDAELNRPHHVYRLFSGSGDLLYIGCARDVEQRVYMHLQTFTMADAFLIHRLYDHHTSERFPTKLAAREAERQAIRNERPLLNRQHNPKRWRRVNGRYIPADLETVEALQALEQKSMPGPDFMAAISHLLAPTP